MHFEKCTRDLEQQRDAALEFQQRAKSALEARASERRAHEAAEAAKASAASRDRSPRRQTPQVQSAKTLAQLRVPAPTSPGVCAPTSPGVRAPTSPGVRAPTSPGAPRLAAVQALHAVQAPLSPRLMLRSPLSPGLMMVPSVSPWSPQMNMMVPAKGSGKSGSRFALQHRLASASSLMQQSMSPRPLSVQIARPQVATNYNCALQGCSRCASEDSDYCCIVCKKIHMQGYDFCRYHHMPRMQLRHGEWCTGGRERWPRD